MEEEKRSRGKGEFRSLIQAAIGSVGIKGGNALLGLIAAALLARYLGPGGYGTYAFVMACVTLVAIPTQLGLPTLVVRETARSQAKGQWGAMRGLWQWSTLVVAASSLLLALVASVFWILLSDRADPTLVGTFAFGIALIPFIALGNLRGAALRGLRRVVLGQLPELVVRPALLILSVVAASLYVFPSQLTPAHAMAAHVLAAVAAFAIGATFLWYCRPPELQRGPIPEYTSHSWLRSAAPLALVGGVQVMNQNVDVLLLGLFRTAEEVGIYKAAVTMAAVIAFGLQAATLTVSPYIAKLHVQGDKERLQRLVTLSARGVLLFAIPVLSVLLFWGELLLRTVFGSEYAAGYLALQILAAGQLVNAGMGTVGMLLNMTGHERETARAVLFAALVNLTLNLFLVPLWGITGAALAGALTLTAWNIAMWRAVHRCLGIESMAFSVFKIGAKA